MANALDDIHVGVGLLQKQKLGYPASDVVTIILQELVSHTFCNEDLWRSLTAEVLLRYSVFKM